VNVQSTVAQLVARLMRRRRHFVLLLAVVSLAAADDLSEEPRIASRPAVAADPLSAILNMTMVAHQAGEAAVGLSCGAISAWLMRKVQGAVLTLTIMGSIATAAALHVKWLNVEQVQVIGLTILRFLSGKLQQASRAADLDEDGELTAEDSRIFYSRVAPLIRRHAALSTGVVGGFAVVYGAMR
jgi:hypothetical protein